MATLMLVSSGALRAVQTAIVEALHTATDTAGKRVNMPTIDPGKLRSAAQMALQIASGDVVWPDDEPLHMPEPEAPKSIFRR